MLNNLAKSTDIATAAVPESAQVANVFFASAAYLASYSDNATVSDSNVSQFLWETINDYQAVSWSNIATGTNSTWTVINTSANVSWVEIKTLQ